LLYTAALPRWRRGLAYLAVPSKLKYDVCRKMLYSNTKMKGISPFKMHRNVNINNIMLSLVFYRVIKAAIIAEKKFITR
jgi:hypothetical protein